MSETNINTFQESLNIFFFFLSVVRFNFGHYLLVHTKVINDLILSRAFDHDTETPRSPHSLNGR